MEVIEWQILNYFNSRPHEEVDDMLRIYLYNTVYFNSRPHEEVDTHYSVGYGGIFISTHDLTRRSTNGSL